MTIKGKKLLILAGADVHCKVVRAAKELGVYTIVTDYNIPSQSPAKKIADEFWMLNITDIEAIVEKCRQKKVDGVLAYCIDPAQIPYQKICEKLSIPCYGTDEQFKILTNKRYFKDFCRKHNIDVIPEYTFEDVNKEKIEYPVLVKPSDSRGSRGQKVCWNKEDINEAVKFASTEASDGKVLIEKYMQGKQDFSLAYIVINSTPYLLKIGDRYLGQRKDNLDRQHICTVIPSISTKGYIEKVESDVKKMIKALKIRFGAVFLQGFIDQNRVYFYDPGMRFPGSDFDIVLKHTSGFDPMKSMIKFALTGDIHSREGNPVGAYNLNNSICIILSIAVKPGKICKFEGLEKFKEDPRVFSVNQRRKKGDVIPATGDIEQRVAELVVCLPSRNDIKDFVENVYNIVRVLDENGNDMIVSKMIRDISLTEKDLIKAN